MGFRTPALKRLARLRAHAICWVMAETETKPAAVAPTAPKPPPALPAPPPPAAKEVGGPKGPEPTRYGDWEQKGRCTDF
jgi:hypothetical protein